MNSLLLRKRYQRLVGTQSEFNCHRFHRSHKCNRLSYDKAECVLWQRARKQSLFIGHSGTCSGNRWLTVDLETGILRSISLTDTQSYSEGTHGVTAVFLLFCHCIAFPLSHCQRDIFVFKYMKT